MGSVIGVSYNTSKVFLFLFLASIVCIEVQQPKLSLNIGNIFVVISSILFVFVNHVRNHGIVKPDFDFIWHGGFFYLFFIMLCLLSAFWSVSNIDTITHGIYLLIVFFGCCTISRYKYTDITRYLFVISFAITILSFLVMVTFPNVGFYPHTTTDLPEARGIFRHQQRSALIMATLTGIFIIYFYFGSAAKILGNGFLFKFRYFILFLMFVFIILSSARLFSLFFMVSLVLTFCFVKLPRFTTFVTLASIVTLSFNYGFFTDLILYYDGEESLSGRTVVWKNTINYAMNYGNFFGMGFATYDLAHFDYIWYQYRPAHAHNSFLNVYFELGVVGVVFILLSIVAFFTLSCYAYMKSGSAPISFFIASYALLASQTGVLFGWKLNTMISLLLVFASLDAKNVNFKRASYAS